MTDPCIWKFDPRACRCQAVIKGVLDAAEVSEVIGKQVRKLGLLPRVGARHCSPPPFSPLLLHSHRFHAQWDFMEALGTGIDRGDVTTWGNERWQPGGAGTGILGSFGVGHNPANWAVRGKQKVKAVWEQIHGAKNLTRGRLAHRAVSRANRESVRIFRHRRPSGQLRWHVPLPAARDQQGLDHPRRLVPLAVGETVILLQPPSTFSRRFYSDGEGMSAK